MIRTKHVLVPSRYISTHLIRPTKVRLVFFFIFSTIWLTSSLYSELTISNLGFYTCGKKPLLGRGVWSALTYFFSLAGALALALPYYWSSFSLLFRSIRSINLFIFVTGFRANEALRSKSMGSPTLNVLAVIPPLSPLILLYNSQ